MERRYRAFDGCRGRAEMCLRRPRARRADAASASTGMPVRSGRYCRVGDRSLDTHIFMC